MPGTKADELVRRTQIRDAAFELAAHAGLKAVTIRDVAERAGLSPGLVLFHFGSKEQLILALLDWVLETTTALRVGPSIAAIEAPGERLLALLRQEMVRLVREPLRIRLFFEFWSAGLWDTEIGLRMQRELDRYRKAFRPITAALLAAEPDRFPGVTADSLAAVTVSIIKGCAVQSMIEPDLDLDAFLIASERLLGQLSGSHQLATRRPSARRSRSRVVARQRGG
jgi:TetR/AcrR family transcriptional regulator, transcriptional repressor of bet genes